MAHTLEGSPIGWALAIRHKYQTRLRVFAKAENNDPFLLRTKKKGFMTLTLLVFATILFLLVKLEFLPLSVTFSLMFAGWATGWKWLTAPNNLAFYDVELITIVRVLFFLCTWNSFLINVYWSLRNSWKPRLIYKLIDSTKHDHIFD